MRWPNFGHKMQCKQVTMTPQTASQFRGENEVDNAQSSSAQAPRLAVNTSYVAKSEDGKVRGSTPQWGKVYKYPMSM